MKKYRTYNEDTVLYSSDYAEHVSAMTGEKLHSKSEIAMELAWRDIRIKELENINSKLNNRIYQHNCRAISAPISTNPTLDKDDIIESLRVAIQNAEDLGLVRTESGAVITGAIIADGSVVLTN